MNPMIEKYEALSNREKGLLIGAAVVVIYLLFELLAFTPAGERNEQLTKQKAQVQQEVSDRSAEIAKYAMALNSDPDAAKKKQLQALKAQLESLDKSLVEMSAGLIASDQLPKLLQDVLSGLDSLTLESVNTLPTEELLLSETSAAAPEDSEEGLIDEIQTDQVGVFKHGVELTFSGSYFDVIDYLKKLEQLDWRFYWDLVDYQVEDYPKARVQLQVYTLSTEIGVLGGR